MVNKKRGIILVFLILILTSFVSADYNRWVAMGVGDDIVEDDCDEWSVDGYGLGRLTHTIFPNYVWEEVSPGDYNTLWKSWDDNSNGYSLAFPGICDENSINTRVNYNGCIFTAEDNEIGWDDVCGFLSVPYGEQYTEIPRLVAYNAEGTYHLIEDTALEWNMGFTGECGVSIAVPPSSLEFNYFSDTKGKAVICADDNFWYPCGSENDISQYDTPPVITGNNLADARNGVLSLEKELDDGTAQDEFYFCMEADGYYQWINSELISQGELPEGLDVDGDRVPAPWDCNDNDDEVYGQFFTQASHPEICGDGKNNDCALADGEGTPHSQASIEYEGLGDSSDICNQNQYSCEGKSLVEYDEGNPTATEGLLCDDETGFCTRENEEDAGCREAGTVCDYLETDDGGVCCGASDENLAIISMREGSESQEEFLCLPSQGVFSEPVVGTSEDFNWDEFWSLNPESEESCAQKDWCWIRASASPFNILTINEPGEAPYDIISNNNQWLNCEAEGPSGITARASDFIESANRFYCYDEGARWSWAECLEGDAEVNGDQYDSSKNGAKRRLAGDGLYKLHPNSDHGSNIKIDASSLDTYYPKNIFSANGYDTLEFMFVYPSLPLYQPARLSLVVTSKDDEVLLSKNILGDVTNNPILKEQRWMHIETSIPLGMEAIKEIRIVSEPSGNEIKVKNIYLSKSGQSPLCTGDPSRADPITETATELETSSWIGEIDTFRYGELVNGREICNQLYDSSLAEGADPRNGKAWLGGTSVVSDSERMCCGDDFNEYYAGESESGGCWNSMVVQEGERIMNVQFDVVSAREEHTFAYNYVFPFEDFSIELEPVFTREFLAGRVNDCPVYPLTMFSRSNYFDECIEANLCLGPQIRDWCWYSTGEDLNEYLSGSGTTNCADGINLTQSFCPLGSQEDLECFGGCLLDRVTFDDGSLHSVTDLTRDQIDFDSLDYCTLPRLGGPATFAYQCPYYIFNTDRFNGKYEINLNSDLNLNDVSNTPVKIADINVDKKIFYGSDEKALRIINQLKPATSPILKTAFAYYPTGDVSESSISISSSDTEDEDISKELKAYSQDVRRLTLEQNSYVVSSVSSKINFYEEKNYACVADECYFPLPGGAIINTISAGLSLGDLSSEEMGIVRSKIDLPGDQTYLIRNPHPDLYELYFVKGDPNIPGNVIMITEDFQPFTEAGTLLVKRLSQQVVYHTETNEEDDLPISKFYGCQPADFIQDNLPPGFSASGFEEKTYCENIGPYFCSFGDSKDGSTTVNTWSEAVLPEVGYQELSEDITPEELSSFMHLRLAEESKGETTIQDRNVSARMTPGLNILPNANFVKSAGRDLYFWEFYEIDEGVVTTKIINELDSTETGIISTEMDDDTLETIKKITLPASTIMVSDKLSVLEGETYQLSHEGTCQDVKIDLYSSEGTGNPYVMVEDETGTATLGVISESGKTPSHLIVTFSGDASCTVLKPLLQILDGTSAPYNYNSQYDGKLYPRAATSCCPEDYCWNGYACVAPMTDSVMAEVPGNGNYYRCIEGQWYDLPRLSDWNGEEQGFCQTDSQCFVLSTNSEFIDENIVARPTTETDPETTINFHQQVDSVKFPNCINQDEFIMDHYCGQNNQWTSRTKFLANELLQYPGTSDFALYCTNPYDALEEFDNKEDPYIYGSAGSTEILTSPLGGDADEPSEETARRAGSCFQIPTSTDEDGGENDAQRLIPLKDNTCINSVCVLKHEDGKAVFSTTLNKPVDSDDSFLKALDLENTACDPESGATLSGSSTSGSVACVTSDPIGGELQHIPNLNAVIYGKEGIGRTFSFSYVTSKISEFFADFFGVETSLSTSLEFVETADNFRDLYILNHERKQVLAVKETLPKTEDVSVTRKALIADYEEFDTPICEFVQENRLSEGFEVKHLQGEKLDCIKDGNNQRVEVLVTAGNQEVLDQLWPQLTGKLRPQIGE